MESFGERFRRVRGERSQQAVADAVGVTRATISQWERGDTRPENIGNEKMQRAVNALGTTAEYLLTGKGQPGRAPVVVQVGGVQGVDDEFDYDARTGVTFPVYDMDVSAGPGRLIAEFVETRKKLYFHRSWMKEIGAKETELKIVKVRGESMQPTLHDDDDIVIHLGKTRIRDGKVFAVAYAGEARVKRLYQMAGGKLRVVSDNPDKVRYPDEIIEGEALNDILVIGQVMHKMGAGGL